MTHENGFKRAQNDPVDGFTHTSTKSHEHAFKREEMANSRTPQVRYQRLRVNIADGLTWLKPGDEFGTTDKRRWLVLDMNCAKQINHPDAAALVVEPLDTLMTGDEVLVWRPPVAYMMTLDEYAASVLVWNQFIHEDNLSEKD